MKTTKLCFHCQTVKKVQKFHKDCKNTDGYSSSCAACRNAMRKGIRKYKKGEICVDTEPETVVHESPFPPHLEKDPDFYGGAIIDGEIRLVDEINILCQKLCEQSHFSLSFDKQGNVRLTTHGNPQKTYKGTDMRKLLVQALAK